MDNQVTLIATFVGDPSVGMLEEVYEIQHMQFEDKRHRENTRWAFQKAFIEYVGEFVRVEFSDEPPHVFERVIDGR